MLFSCNLLGFNAIVRCLTFNPDFDLPYCLLEIVQFHVLGNHINPGRREVDRLMYWLSVWIFMLLSTTYFIILWVMTWFLFADLWRCSEVFQDYLPYSTLVAVSRTAALEVNYELQAYSLNISNLLYRILNGMSLFFVLFANVTL